MQRPSKPWLVGGGIYVSLAAILAAIALLSNPTWAWAWRSLIGMLLPFGYFLVYPLYLLASAAPLEATSTPVAVALGALAFASIAAINIFLIWRVASALTRRWAGRR